MSKPRTARRFVPVTLDNNWFVHFPTDKGGVLSLAPAKVQAQFRFVVRAHDEEGGALMVLTCQLRLTDDQGHCWQVESTFSSRQFMEEWIDLTRREPPRWFCHAPRHWRDAFRKGVLITGAGDLFDDRFYRFFYFDRTAFCIHFKYLYPAFDVTPLAEGKLLVRVSGLFGNWDRMAIEGPSGEPVRFASPNWEKMSEEELDALPTGPDGSDDLENLEPLVYPLDCRRLLFCNQAYYDQDEGFWEDNPLPIPLTFQRVAGKGEPQKAVTWRESLEEPRPATPLPRKRKQVKYTVFPPLTNHVPLTYLVRPSGQLRIQPGPIHIACRLEKFCLQLLQASNAVKHERSYWLVVAAGNYEGRQVEGGGADGPGGAATGG